MNILTISSEAVTATAAAYEGEGFHVAPAAEDAQAKSQIHEWRRRRDNRRSHREDSMLEKAAPPFNRTTKTPFALDLLETSTLTTAKTSITTTTKETAPHHSVAINSALGETVDTNVPADTAQQPPILSEAIRASVEEAETIAEEIRMGGDIGPVGSAINASRYCSLVGDSAKRAEKETAALLNNSSLLQNQQKPHHHQQKQKHNEAVSDIVPQSQTQHAAPLNVEEGISQVRRFMRSALRINEDEEREFDARERRARKAEAEVWEQRRRAEVIEKERLMREDRAKRRGGKKGREEAMAQGGSGQVALGFITARSDFKPLPKSSSQKEENAPGIFDARVHFAKKSFVKSPSRPNSSKLVYVSRPRAVMGSASFRPKVSADVAQLWLSQDRSRSNTSTTSISKAEEYDSSTVTTSSHRVSSIKHMDNLAGSTVEKDRNEQKLPLRPRVVKVPSAKNKSFIQFGGSSDLIQSLTSTTKPALTTSPTSVSSAPSIFLDSPASPFTAPYPSSAQQYSPTTSSSSSSRFTRMSHIDPSSLIFSLSDVAGGIWTDLPHRSTTLSGIVRGRNEQMQRREFLNRPTLASIGAASSARNPIVKIPQRRIVSNLHNVLRGLPE